jgi:hypothetical protein
MLSTPADYSQGMTGVLLDIYQFTPLNTYFYPTTSRADAAKAFSPLQLWIAVVNLMPN